MKKTKVKITMGVIICLMLILTFCKYIVPTFLDVYSLRGDYVPSIRMVLDETKLVYHNEISTKNNVLFKSYEYKNQETVEEDLKTYTNYLIQMEQFQVLRSYDLMDPANTSIYLGKKSHVKEEEIILVTIDYTSSSYKISVSKKRGTLLN